MEPVRLILSPKEAIMLAAILAGLDEQLSEIVDELGQDEREMLLTAQAIRRYLPAIDLTAGTTLVR